MKPSKASAPNPTNKINGLMPVVLLVGFIVSLLFIQSCRPGVVHSSNDGPLGAAVAEPFHMPEAFTGVWQSLNWVGGFSGSSTPNFTNALLWAFGPVGFAKFYAPISIFLLGLAAWLAFRQLKLSPVACLVGALAAALNGGFFSYACWGLGTLTLAVACFFLALAAWGSDPAKRSWIRVVLAGFAIGMSIMEGFDNGAILSLYFAAFVLYRTWVENPAEPGRLVGGAVRLALVAVAAAVLAAHGLIGLVSTQIQGVVGMEQDAETKAQRWNDATQWSLPKVETLRLFISGMYGYRMDTENGGVYWGGVGRHPAWDDFLASDNPSPDAAPQAQVRHSGSGFYCGVIVCLLAAWAVFGSIAKSNPRYEDHERKMIWFWAAMAFVSLLLAWGRHAPFYQIVYALPYFSTMRNPIKFLHPLNVSILVLFAYGVQGLWRSWSQQTATQKSVKEQFVAWWGRTQGFDRYWIVGSVIFAGFSLLLTMLYGSSRSEVVKFLQLTGYGDPKFAAMIFEFSLKELLWYLLFLAGSAVFVALMMCGALKRGGGLVALGLLVALTGLDLSRANLPWINHYNYIERYAAAPLYDFLKDKPWEHRAQMLPGALLQQQFVSVQGRIQPQQAQQLNAAFGQLARAYGAEWVQNQFQYYNIQSLDIVQERSPKVENVAYRMNFPQADPFAQLRMMQLANGRYFIAFGGPMIPPLNQIKAGLPGEFREVMPVWPEYDGNYPRPVEDTNSPFALIEYTGVLPRARLFTNWQVESDPNKTLATLVSRPFDPWSTVLVEGDVPAPTATEPGEGGTVEILDYHPKHIVMQADVKTASVLLLNDKHDPNWKVYVDGIETSVLKCNFLMRGVYLKPGQYEVVWKFEPPNPGLGVSVAAIFVGLALCGFLAVQSRRPDADAAPEKK